MKWKGSLFFRIVMCIVDEDESLNKFGKWLTPNTMTKNRPCINNFWHRESAKGVQPSTLLA